MSSSETLSTIGIEAPSDFPRTPYEAIYSRVLNLQERAIFGFFVTGFSALDSLSYGLYVAGAVARSKDFPITVSALRRVSPESTQRRFAAIYPNGLPSSFAFVIDSKPYKAWKRGRARPLVQKLKVVAPSSPIHCHIGAVPANSALPTSWLLSHFRASKQIGQTMNRPPAFS